MYASSYGFYPTLHELTTEELPVPDLFVALDSMWMGYWAPVVSVGLPDVELPKPISPMILVEWPDLSALPSNTMDWLSKTIINKINDGERVEIGCVGGHGRTGYLLSVLIALEEGCGAGAAIKRVRERYCSEAVESYRQLEAVYEFLGEEESAIKNDWVVYSTTVKTKGQSHVITHFYGEESDSYRKLWDGLKDG